MSRYIDPVKDLGPLLLGVEKPARYTGGEYGRLARKEAALQTIIAFPDLYEIGMSNQALRIIYNGLNRLPGVSCDRAFAPAPDFEKLLRDTGTPLYGLDTGIALADTDMLMFTLGYELGISGVFSILDTAGIPLRCADRGNCPIVIAGGPAVSNPLPYAPFIDAFWIGEAEGSAAADGAGLPGSGSFFELAAELAKLKTDGAAAGGEGRAALLAKIAEHPCVWTPEKGTALRAIYAGFGGEAAVGAAPIPVFPVPGMKTVQHHGAVEIMRGCPNGCRFCHAGFWYRPQRAKKPERIIAEAEAFINLGGYREISLSSLSSGDYEGVGELVDALNARFADRRVSFQMPSLKVSTFSLSLLEKISETRRSGLTFAVETPVDAWQAAINKEVKRDSVVEILREAKKRGWRGAKFYFMIGLPVETAPFPAGNVEACGSGASCGSALPLGSEGSEEAEIAAFVADVGRRAAMHFTINVGIFVPKPHTPYQWAAQIESGAALAKLNYIRDRLKPLGHKVSVSDPLLSRLEGILSRGDERAGLMAEAAYLDGSRLDPWSEYISKDTWLAVLEDNREAAAEFLSAKNTETPLPWQGIRSGVSTAFLCRELEKSRASAQNSKITVPCEENCDANCGICGKNVKIIKNHNCKPSHVNRLTDGVNNNTPPPAPQNSAEPAGGPDPSIFRVLFSFSKTGGAVFHGHLSVIEIYSMAFTRAGLPVLYTQGFNPLAKIEFASPLSTGVGAAGEIAAADFSDYVVIDDFTQKLNASLPEGFRIEKAESYFIPRGWKKYSLSSLLWGFGYFRSNASTRENNEIEYVPMREEKQYRQKRLENGAALFSLTRHSALAKNIIDKPEKKDAASEAADNGAVVQPWLSYYRAYHFLYPPRMC
jgi:radical SAM superfamily enzyme YgiQ (UPF0313 family)